MKEDASDTIQARKISLCTCDEYYYPGIPKVNEIASKKEIALSMGLKMKHLSKCFREDGYFGAGTKVQNISMPNYEAKFDEIRKNIKKVLEDQAKSSQSSSKAFNKSSSSRSRSVSPSINAASLMPPPAFKYKPTLDPIEGTPAKTKIEKNANEEPGENSSISPPGAPNY